MEYLPSFLSKYVRKSFAVAGKVFVVIGGIVGKVFIVIAIVFLFIHTFVVVRNPTENFSRDLFGFVISEPPIWKSFVPYLGFYVGIIFEFFSLHGMVGIFICVVLLLIGPGLQAIGRGFQKVSAKIPLTPEEEEEEELKKFLSGKTGVPITLRGWGVRHSDGNPDKRFIHKKDVEAYLKSLQDNQRRKAQEK